MTADRFTPRPLVGAGDDRAATRTHSLQRIAEAADYVSQRTLQLDEQVHEVEKIAQHLGALARQLRTLSSNTMLEANRMRMSGPLAEIARQMRRISQQISESNDQLSVTLRGYSIATGELHQAATALLGDINAPRAALEAPVPPMPFPETHTRPSREADPTRVLRRARASDASPGG